MLNRNVKYRAAVAASCSLLCIFSILMLYKYAFAPTKGIVSLNGLWQITEKNNRENSKKSLNTASWDNIELPTKQLMPGDLIKKTITVPDNYIETKQGYYWLRKTFTLKEIPDTELLLQIREIMNCDRIYVNGHFIGQTGKFPPHFKSGWCSFRSYPLDKNILSIGDNVVAIQMYFNSEAWVSGPMRIIEASTGSRIKMYYDIFLNHAMQGLTFLLFPISLFFIFLYIKRTKETTYLYFGLCTLFLSILIALQYFEIFYTDTVISSNTIFKITQTGMIFFPPTLALFFRSYVRKEAGLLRRVLYYSIPAILWILMLASHERYQILKWRNLSLMLIPLYSLDIITVSSLHIIRKSKEGMLIFIGLLPIVTLGLHDVLTFALNQTEGSIPLFVYGIPIMLFVIAIHLTNRFVSSLNQTEKLNDELDIALRGITKLANLEQELAVAKRIQLSSVPTSLPHLSWIDLSVTFNPAETIGGDFYNFHVFDDESIGILVTDVSGHGVPASLITAMVKVVFSQLKEEARDAEIFMRKFNEMLKDNIDDHFLTAGYLYLDRTTNTATYARAGHEPLLILHNGKNRIEEVLPKGRAIGIFDDAVFDVASFSFSEGDRIVLYTDCIPEAMNSSKKIYGIQSFRENIAKSRQLTPAEFGSAMHNILINWSHNNELEDDLTLIVLDILCCDQKQDKLPHKTVEQQPCYDN
jgi:hypothetical protein